MDPMSVNPTIPELIDIWQSALADIDALCARLSEGEWLAQTPCPGWTVADVVAHTADIESFMAGEPRPEHSPDWDSLPHASGPFGQFTEVGVDARRGRPREEVLAELRARAEARRAQLDALPVDAEVMGVTGAQVSLSRMVRTRTFDAWVHEQDIRAAIGQDGDWSSRPAVVSFQQMASALPYVWGKGVGAPVGAVVRITVTGPDLEADLLAIVGSDGRATASGPVAEPTVHLTVAWPDYMRLSCGRVDVHEPEFLERLTLAGDAALGECLLEELAITP